MPLFPLDLSILPDPPLLKWFLSLGGDNIDVHSPLTPVGCWTLHQSVCHWNWWVLKAVLPLENTRDLKDQNWRQKNIEITYRCSQPSDVKSFVAFRFKQIMGFNPQSFMSLLHWLARLAWCFYPIACGINTSVGFWWFPSAAFIAPTKTTKARHREFLAQS